LFIYFLQLLLVEQSNYEAASDKQHEVYTVSDKTSSDRFAAVAIEGYLNYKVTHHEGKVCTQHILTVHKLDI